MPSEPSEPSTPRPSPTTSRLLSVVLVLTWDALRLSLFPDDLSPLTDVLPLLVCVWTRDRPALAGMAIAIAALDAVDIFWIVPVGALSTTARWLAYGATLVSITIEAAVVNAIIQLRGAYEASLERARRAMEQVRSQARELQAQSEELRAADRHKTEFLGTLSHELRNPLAAIRYALELIDAGGEAEVRARAVIRRQLDHLVRLVDDLLDISRIVSNKLQLCIDRVDLAATIQQAVDAASPEIQRAGHTLTVELPEAPIVLDADRDRLVQVVANLLGNAARYTPTGGRIHVSARADEGTATISVTDTGVGLRPEDLQRVFERFTQVGETSRGGLGIGLSLVDTIVRMHGGQVMAHSEGHGRGSRFDVCLPLKTTVPVPEPEREPDEHRELGEHARPE